MTSVIIQGDDPTCQQCGEQFPKRRRGPSIFCTKACWTASERDKRFAKRKAEGLRIVGDPAPCAGCGIGITYAGGHGKYCDACRGDADRAKAVRWKEQNQDKLRLIRKNADTKKKACPKWRSWRREYAKAQWAKTRSNPKNCIDHRMGQLVRTALRDAKAGRRWERLVDYSLSDLMVHLERQFSKGMGWHNMGEWHIDHIVPKSKFNYSLPEDDEFKACWALANLRPLWAEDNLKKSDRRTHLI